MPLPRRCGRVGSRLHLRKAEAEAEVRLREALGSRVMVLRPAWWSGPGAALGDRARDDLAAMFTAYDDGGLTGDPTVRAGVR